MDSGVSSPMVNGHSDYHLEILWSVADVLNELTKAQVSAFMAFLKAYWMFELMSMDVRCFAKDCINRAWKVLKAFFFV
ncbi:MAG: hypothetical protein NZ729_07750 [Methylococcales bacterium]|nr:hypothetical protein [Methylococcales bacterium]